MISSLAHKEVPLPVLRKAPSTRAQESFPPKKRGLLRDKKISKNRYEKFRRLEIHYNLKKYGDPKTDRTKSQAEIVYLEKHEVL